jgi:MFS family permease
VVTVQRSLKLNIVVIYLMGFFYAFMVVIPVFVPLAQGFGLSMAQVLQTQALFALTVAVCEVPSGYIADIWGRRLALLLGSLLYALGFLSLLWADDFVDFMVYEFILGLGVSLVSGADLALLYDSETHLAESGQGATGASRSLSRLISIEAGASGIAGIVASLVLLMADMKALVLLQALCGFMPLLLSFLLVETPRPVMTQGHAGNARAIARLLLFGSPVVLWTALAIAAFGLMATYAFWIYQKYWEFRGVPVASFGYIWAVFGLVISLSARYASNLEALLGWRRLLWATAVLPLVGLLGMALAEGWIGVMFGVAVQLGRGLSMTLFYDALNRRMPGDFRATVNSLVSLLVRSLFIVTGPVLGWALDVHGEVDTLLVLSVLFAPLFALVILGLGLRIQRESEEVPGPALAG